jgi:flagellar protein FliS
MRYRTSPWHSYQKVAAQTASPGQLVLMLYDGAIRFLEKALTGFAHDDPQMFHQVISNNILRTQEIINELNVSLNMAQGGDFAANMRRLYHYLDWRLQQSNHLKQEAGIREVISRLMTLREAWAQMLEQRDRHPTQPVGECAMLA